MNAGRRAFITLAVELIDHCLDKGSMTEDGYVALGESIKLMQKEEYWSLRNMSKHADKNDSTARQVAISEAALPELEAAHEAWSDEDLEKVMHCLVAARDAEPSVKKKSKPGLRKSKK